jgi:CRISPR-associated endonuclease/helicase Cas3
LQGTPITFWGKFRQGAEPNRSIEWHPLPHHCADVGAVAEALLALPVWRDRLTHIAGQEITDLCRARLSVIAVLHDIGKLNIGFQALGRSDLGPTAGHVREALGALDQGATVFGCLAPLNDWGEGTAGILESAICHHGKPYAMSEHKWQASWWAPRGGLDPRKGAVDLFDCARAWFPDAFVAGGPELPASAPFTHAFAGLVMLADWIGSDTRFFPFSEDLRTDRMWYARARAQKALSALSVDLPLDSRLDPLRRTAFRRVTSIEYSPRAAQVAVAELPRPEPGSVTILEAETGSGKTEAALARFIALFEAGDVDGLYFALPTRSAATQMHRRIHDAARSAFPNPPPVVLAVPGYLRVDDVEGRKLAPFEVLWADQDRYRFRGWAAEGPKRYLAGCIVVGTVDQVLLSALSVGHAHLRATALLRHLLVVDEVHASDAYMTRILETVLARQIEAGGHAMLLSATLGGEARGRLLHPRAHSPRIGRETAEATPYPLITHRSRREHSVAVTSDGVNRSIEVELQPWLSDDEVLGRAALRAALAGAKVLVIRNTVNDCVKTQLALEGAACAFGAHRELFSCAGVVVPHHSRYSRMDRQALDTALEERLGKERSGEACVVVATQTVQQSLDVDADILFTDLCPIDVLLQRLGRLHRHQRPRPSGFEVPRATVVVPPDRDLGALLRSNGEPKNFHGLGRVYSDVRMLEATWRLAEQEPRWRIPEMNRRLVEDGLHSSVLNAIANEGGTRWQAHTNHVLGVQRGHQRHADLNIVDWSRPYCDASFPSDPGERVMTRLGEGDRRVRFFPPPEGPLGNPVEELILRPWWTRGVNADCDRAEDVITHGGAVRFAFGGNPFVYDRLGVRPDEGLDNEQQDGDGA